MPHVALAVKVHVDVDSGDTWAGSMQPELVGFRAELLDLDAGGIRGQSELASLHFFDDHKADFLADLAGRWGERNSLGSWDTNARPARLGAGTRMRAQPAGVGKRMRAQADGELENERERIPPGRWETHASAARWGVGKRMRTQSAGALGNACECSLLRSWETHASAVLDPTAPDRSDLLYLHHASSRDVVVLDGVQNAANSSLHVFRQAIFRNHVLVHAAIRE